MTHNIYLTDTTGAAVACGDWKGPSVSVTRRWALNIMYVAGAAAGLARLLMAAIKASCALKDGEVPGSVAAAHTPGSSAYTEASSPADAPSCRPPG